MYFHKLRVMVASVMLLTSLHYLNRAQAVMCEAIPLEHSAPQVQPPPLSLSYEISPAVNVLQYIDHSGFCTKFGNELEAIGQVENMVEVGRGLVNTLYTYRAVGKVSRKCTESLTCTAFWGLYCF